MTNMEDGTGLLLLCVLLVLFGFILGFNLARSMFERK